MADELFIEDGYTRTHTIAAVAGLHPRVQVLFRPALPRERLSYSARLATRDADQIERYERETLARYILEIDGSPRAEWEPKLGRMQPTVRQQLIDVVLGYTPAEEAADAKN